MTKRRRKEGGGARPVGKADAASPDRLHDCCALLGLAPGASSPAVRRAFLEQARLWHPDKCSAPDAAERFRRVREAFESLTSSRCKSVELATSPSSASPTKFGGSATSTQAQSENAKPLKMPRARRRSSGDESSGCSGVKTAAGSRPSGLQALIRQSHCQASGSSQVRTSPAAAFGETDDLFHDLLPGHTQPIISDFSGTPPTGNLIDGLAGKTIPTIPTEAPAAPLATPRARGSLLKRLPQKKVQEASPVFSSPQSSTSDWLEDLPKRSLQQIRATCSPTCLSAWCPPGTGHRPAESSRPKRAASIRGRLKAVAGNDMLGSVVQQRLSELRSGLQALRIKEVNAEQATGTALDLLMELEALEANLVVDVQQLRSSRIQDELKQPWWRSSGLGPAADRARSLVERWEKRCGDV